MEAGSHDDPVQSVPAVRLPPTASAGGSASGSYFQSTRAALTSGSAHQTMPARFAQLSARSDGFESASAWSSLSWLSLCAGPPPDEASAGALPGHSFLVSRGIGRGKE